jgi:hypothetical protein
MAFAAGGRDVEENNFVSAIMGVRSGALGGVSGIAQVDELDAFHDTAVVHIEAGDDALGQHGRVLTGHRKNS